MAGSTSFEDQRTVNGHVCSTFKQACLERHLIQDDQEWTRCFHEAQLFSSGASLRNLFIVALTFGGLTDPVGLWIDFCVYICDDLQYQLELLFPDNHLYTAENDELFHQGSAIFDYGLYLMDVKLKDQNKSLEDYQMPRHEYNWIEAFRTTTSLELSTNELINEQLDYNIHNEHQLYTSKYTQFNNDQKAAFDRIVERIESDTPNNIPLCFFLHGPAGTGKTFVYNTIANYFRSQNQIAICVASSGIAAILLTGGRTSHSRFKIPLSIHDQSVCYIPRGTHLARLLERTALIIWDEVPMQHRNCFEAVDRVLRDIRQVDTLFGGIPVILGGDFAQIPPVIRNGDRPLIVQASIRNSYIWNYVDVIHLTLNMRVRGTSVDAIHFKDWLYRMTYSPEYQNTSIGLPNYIHTTTSLSSLISQLYPEELLADAINRPQVLFKTAILATRNITVDDLNQEVLDSMPGNSLHIVSMDEAETDDNNDEIFQITPEYLQTINPNNFPPARLSLKVGCIVMLLRNLNPKAGLCNGTRLIIKEIGSYVLRVLVLKDDSDGIEQIELIPRITLSTMEDEYPFVLKRTQFPVKLSFAMTINKSQGQSLENVGIDLRHSTFTHGQLYVALSRSSNVHNIYVLQPEHSLSHMVDNVVYPELLLE